MLHKCLIKILANNISCRCFLFTFVVCIYFKNGRNWRKIITTCIKNRFIFLRSQVNVGWGAIRRVLIIFIITAILLFLRVFLSFFLNISFIDDGVSLTLSLNYLATCFLFLIYYGAGKFECWFSSILPVKRTFCRTFPSMIHTSTGFTGRERLLSLRWKYYCFFKI